MNNKIISLFEIFLIVVGGIAFAYNVAETNEIIQYLPLENRESKFITFVREKALDYLSNGMVSAQTLSVQTCLLDKNGTSCQEYPSQVCNDQCTTSCFPGRRSDFSSCQLGTCFDGSLGLCSNGAPRASCENNNGTWYAETPVQCARRCCLIAPDGSGGASQAKLTTSQECNYLGRTLGAPVQWDSQISSEIQCISKVRTKREGACVLGLDIELNKYDCKFTTETQCLTSGGTFYVDQLCTNPQLNTKCELTGNTACFENKDGVYFVDSCGNRANIYDSTKRNVAAYWSSVVPVDQSCSLSSGSTSLANQARCGNCNYFQGSICGTPKPSLDKQPITGQYVCKDLSCTDRNGEKRQHGESWCSFESWTGLDGAEGTSEERAVDVPGSRHYKERCYEGEVILEPCAEFRNGICVEQDVKDGFTNAQCRANTEDLCISYNEDKEKLAQCEENPDCYLKHTEIDKFKFDVCVPKYPGGFELSDEVQEDSKAICGAASQTCTYYEKKGVDFKWSCKVNCACKEAQFAEKMNNLCMSLGDCGSHVNLAGKLGKGYSTKGGGNPKITTSYIDGLKKYITPKLGQRVDGLSEEQVEAALGIDFSLDQDVLASRIAQFGLAAGITVSIQQGTALAPTTFSLGGWAGAFNAALVGAGIGYIVGAVFGLEGRDMTVAVIIGAAAGAGYAVLAAQIPAIAVAPVVGWIAAIVVAVIVAVLSIGGVGKYRERKVEFTCLPWQPPAGGADCSKCNELGVECTAYKCRSLGKTCELLNPNTEDETCANIAPNDVSAPIMSLNKTSLVTGLTSEESSNGVRIKSSASDGCLQEGSAVSFDIITNEPAQCKISSIRPTSYDEMEDSYFDSSDNRYVMSHVESAGMPDLDELGVSGADPARRGQYDLYVLCQDKSGNPTDNSYNVRFCVSPANDIQRPQITKFVPESPGFAGLNSEIFNLQFYTDEPATCRFSTTDQSYETMENAVNCQNSISQSTINGWLCSTQLPITGNDNNYYFRCADKPWLGEDVQQNSVTLEPGRNVATESDNYVVKKTTTALTISSISPNDKTILSAIEPVSVTLDITTSGGIDSGKAFCEYSFNGEQYIDFAITSLSNHKQTFTSLFSGDYDIRLKCTDKVGNTAEGNARFKIETDTIGPTITRLYSTGSSLTVITNEDSICEYSKDSCAFEFGTGTALSGASKVHTMSYNNGLTYRIKCKDTFGNLGSCMSVSAGY